MSNLNWRKSGLKPVLTLLFFTLSIVIFAFSAESQPQTWQSTLEQAFPAALVETFDNVPDWQGICDSGDSGADWSKSTHPSNFPSQLKFDGFIFYGRGACLNGSTEYKWIQSREPKYLMRRAGKSAALSYPNFFGNDYDVKFGPSTLSWYFGNGSENSGYDPLYLFFAYKPHHEQINIRTTGYAWHPSGANGEYYLTKSDGSNPQLKMPNDLIINGLYVHNDLPVGVQGSAPGYYATYHNINLGSLAENHWTYGDSNNLGFDTIYVKLAGGAYPTNQADGYLVYENGFWVMDSPTTVPLSPGIITKLLDIEAGYISDSTSYACSQACSGEPTHGRTCNAYGESFMILASIWGAPQNSVSGLYWYPNLFPGGWNGTCYSEGADYCMAGCTNYFPVNNWDAVNAKFQNSYINGEWLGVEIKMKLSSTNGANDGSIDIWTYSENGSLIGQWSLPNLITKSVGPAIKYNRIRFGGNRLPLNYVSNVAAPSWENRYYIDDVIVSPTRIGPAYFALVNNTPLPPDTTPPAISNILAANITQYSASINWVTDEPSDSQVVFVSPCPSTGCSSPIVSSLTTSHTINISNLTPSTNYTYQVKSKDISGNLATSTNKFFITPATQTTPLANRVMVVYNAKYPESLDVANYYMMKRGIPETNKCAINITETGYYIQNVAGTQIDTYHTFVKTPVQNCLNTLGRGNIIYIVFSYMTPYKIYDTYFYGTQRSIDSLVADIWNTGNNEPYYSLNPYMVYCGSASNTYPAFLSLADYRAQNPTKLVYSVWRLDAATADQAKGLVDKAITAETNGISGQGCFDRRYGPVLNPSDDSSYNAGDWDIAKSAEFIAAAGFPVTTDTNDVEFGTPPAPLRCDNAAFYAGWYSYGHYNDVFTWATGAIGWHIDSLSLWNPRANDSWGGGAIARGITVTTGCVGEPYMNGIPHFDGFYKNILEGANVGDAMLRNTEELQWMIVNVGDPLYRPFPGEDATPPIITSVVSSGLNATSATISWQTDDSSSSQADYGTTASYGSSTPLNATMTSAHSQTITGLSANTTYHFQVKSRDAAGNLATSQDYNFTTTPLQYGRADTSQNGCVEMNELTSFINRWKVSNVDVTLKEIIEAIGAWKGCS